jgi:hypothetical protein
MQENLIFEDLGSESPTCEAKVDRCKDAEYSQSEFLW